MSPLPGADESHQEDGLDNMRQGCPPLTALQGLRCWLKALSLVGPQRSQL